MGHPQTIIFQLEKFFELESFESQQLDDYRNQGKLITSSNLYFIKSTAFFHMMNEKMAISCVFNSQNGKIQYWREE